MKRKKVYVIFNGENAGIYDSWEECEYRICYRRLRFKGFENVQKITLGNEILIVGKGSFAGIKIKEIVIPSSVLLLVSDPSFTNRDVTLVPTEEEEMFWKAFAEGRYCPELVFGENAEYVNVEKHPMALWKCREM